MPVQRISGILPGMNYPMHLYPGLTDSHLHILQMAEKELPVEDILVRCFAEGMQYALDVGVSGEGFETRLSIGSRFPGLFHSAGYSPSVFAGIVNTRDTEERLGRIATELDTMLRSPRIVAVGEIGLDYYWMDGPKDLQEKLFVMQLDAAARLGLPVVIHSRDADDDMVRILARHAGPRKGVMHCFSSGPETAEKLLELGFFISFAGNLTYPKSEELRKSAAVVPGDRLLIETDSPYLPPVPFRGTPNHPGNTGYTLETLAAIRRTPPEELASGIRENFLRLFRPGVS